jgi:hypothetical protein
MTFANATIQGHVNYIAAVPNKTDRPLAVLLMSVGDKKSGKSTSYKVSIWDRQAMTALQLIHKGQIVTLNGKLALEHFPTKSNQEYPFIRIDFATILDYGVTEDITYSGETTINEKETKISAKEINKELTKTK